MDKNEIKSFRTRISLKEYLSINNIISERTFKVGDISYNNLKTRLQCQHTNNDVYTLIGKNINKDTTYLFQNKSSIIEIDYKEMWVYVEVVLKEQIKDLKYIEQTELFKDEQGKD